MGGLYKRRHALQCTIYSQVEMAACPSDPQTYSVRGGYYVAFCCRARDEKRECKQKDFRVATVIAAVTPRLRYAIPGTPYDDKDGRNRTLRMAGPHNDLLQLPAETTAALDFHFLV